LSKKAYISSDENKEWNSRHMMDVNMNTTNNFKNLLVCSAHFDIHNG